MRHQYCASSPHLFRPVKRCFWLALALLILLAAVIPAPLEEPANLAMAPNPAKSAWFLLWIQELVSYRIWLIYPVCLAALLFIALPWLLTEPPDKAHWLGRTHRLQALVVLAGGVVIVILTVVGLFFRGENWSLVWPF